MYITRTTDDHYLFGKQVFLLIFSPPSTHSVSLSRFFRNTQQFFFFLISLYFDFSIVFHNNTYISRTTEPTASIIPSFGNLPKAAVAASRAQNHNEWVLSYAYVSVMWSAPHAHIRKY